MKPFACPAMTILFVAAVPPKVIEFATAPADLFSAPIVNVAEVLLVPKVDCTTASPALTFTADRDWLLATPPFGACQLNLPPATNVNAGLPAKLPLVPSPSCKGPRSNAVPENVLAPVRMTGRPAGLTLL